MCLIRVLSKLCRGVALQELSLTPLAYPIIASLSLLKCIFKWATFYFYLSRFLKWYFYLYLSNISLM